MHYGLDDIGRAPDGVRILTKTASDHDNRQMEQETADRINLKNSWDHSDQELDIKEFRSWSKEISGINLQILSKQSRKTKRSELDSDA